MHWNYRVVRTTINEPGEPYSSYAIHEAHYRDGSTDPTLITAAPVTTDFGDVDDLRAALEKMLAALDKPTLYYEDF